MSGGEGKGNKGCSGAFWDGLIKKGKEYGKND
jgi:hypothetical protein